MQIFENITEEWLNTKKKFSYRLSYGRIKIGLGLGLPDPNPKWINPLSDFEYEFHLGLKFHSFEFGFEMGFEISQSIFNIFKFCLKYMNKYSVFLFLSCMSQTYTNLQTGRESSLSLQLWSNKFLYYNRLACVLTTVHNLLRSRIHYVIWHQLHTYIANLSYT